MWARASLLVVVALAGCGDDDTARPAPSTPDSSAPVTTTRDPSASVTTTIVEPEPPAPVLAVFGDSLAFQAWSEIEAAVAGAGYTLAGAATPGDAMCDATDAVDAVMARRPAYVVLAYVGNNVTPCTGRAVGEPLADIYENAAELVAVTTAAGGSELVLVGPPDMTGAHFDVTAPLVRERYERVAGRHEHVTFVDGRERLSPDGFTERRPCLASEGPELGCVDGLIVVRFYDGVHLDWPDDGYSAGGRRWADTIVSSVATA